MRAKQKGKRRSRRYAGTAILQHSGPAAGQRRHAAARPADCASVQRTTCASSPDL
ncbi:hypothetical protein BSIN_5283 [Burkholderia singularis]|uniref:Uncharacterized protein n=1 Tax=Burkholderia singularis TaxID=1503053 RepID=A0A238HCV5_9BURK|nr:hypothetical protein BSIN_5283 [Burkholderia singularis]